MLGQAPFYHAPRRRAGGYGRNVQAGGARLKVTSSAKSAVNRVRLVKFNNLISVCTSPGVIYLCCVRFPWAVKGSPEVRWGEPNTTGAVAALILQESRFSRSQRRSSSRYCGEGWAGPKPQRGSPKATVAIYQQVTTWTCH